MGRIIHFIIRYPIATILMMVILVFMGVYSSRHMPVDLFPNISVPVVNVISHYPGASPEDMEMFVSRPIESALRTIPGVKRVASISAQGISRVTVEFTWGTDVSDAMQFVQARLSRLRNTLPAGVEPRLENIGTTLQEVSGYVFYGGEDLVRLRSIVRYNIAGRLMDVPGVSSVEVLGGDKRAIWITIKPEMLARLHATIPEIIDTIKKHNVSTVAGFIQRSGREYLIRGDIRLRTLDDIRAIPVINRHEQPVLLGDVTDVHKGVVPRHYEVHGDGVPAVAIIIRKQPGASTIHVVENVDKALSNLKTLLPPGTVVKKFYDQSEVILESRQEIIHDLLIGAVLAVLVLYFFLGSLVPTLIVAFTIPLTLIATIAIMRLFGLGFNIITMTALALVVGIVVDDAIVVAENIFRHGRETADPGIASINGTVEIAGPDVSGTFTTVAAFIPLVIVTGIAALFLRPFGLTISAALLVSLILSLTLVPLLSSRSRSVIIQREGFLGDQIIHGIDNLLQGILRFSLRRRWIILTVAVLLFGATSLVAFLGKTTILPPIDEGALLIEYVLPPGTSLKESNRIGDLVEKIALTNPDVTCVYRRTGSPVMGYQIEGVNMGELVIKLKPKTRRSHTAWEIMSDLKKVYSKIPGCLFLYHQPTQEKIDESFSGLPAFFGVTIYGQDMEKLIFLAREVESILSRTPNISNVINNTKVKTSQIDVRLKYKSLALYGLDPANVLTTLQAAYIGVEATRIIHQRAEVPVMVNLNTGQSRDLNMIRKLPVAISKGAMLPLENVADIQVHHAPAMITRLNGQREVTLIAEVEGNILKVIKILQKKFKDIHIPRGYQIVFSGQYPVIIQTAVDMLIAVFWAVVLIYFIMAIQFDSWAQPLVILIAIPLTMVGAIIALFVTTHGLDISVGMGVMTLAGIAVNNAIVLIDYANKYRTSHVSMDEALLKAVSVRLRPILLTTFTTVAALLPAAISISTGSRIFQPFAIAVIGGLIANVGVTLIIIPTLAIMFAGNHK